MKTIKYILLVLFTICFVYIIPVSFISNKEESQNKPDHEMPIPSVAYGFELSQQIIPSGDYISLIELSIQSLECDTSQGYLSIHLLDSGKNSIYENNILLCDLPSYGWFGAVRDVAVVPDTIYYLTLETVGANDDGPVIAYYQSQFAASKEEENQELTYARLPLNNCVLKIKITYINQLSKPEYIIYYVFIMFILSFTGSHIFQALNNPSRKMRPLNH